MSIRDRLQAEIKAAMLARDTFRLEALRMAKGALLLKEKEKAKGEGITDEEAVAALRSEARKRQQSAVTFREVGKEEEAKNLDREVEILEEFMPKQLTEEELEARARAYVAEHPEVNHAGKLTGALKKELGDLADGRILAEVAKRVI